LEASKDKWWSKELSLTKGLVHGKLLIPTLDRLLKKVNWKKEEIDLIAVDIGPGSYTGLRVGLAMAKTMSYFLKTKIIGVASLDVLLYSVAVPVYRDTANYAWLYSAKAEQSKYNIQSGAGYDFICPVIDARWNQIYAALYKKGRNGYERATDNMAINPDALIKILKRYLNKSDTMNGLVFGDALKSYRDVLGGLGGRVVFGTEDLWVPKASNVALLGYQNFKLRKADNAISLLPLYLRPTEAEINLKKK